MRCLQHTSDVISQAWLTSFPIFPNWNIRSKMLASERRGRRHREHGPRPLCSLHLITLQYYSLLRFFVRNSLQVYNLRFPATVPWKCPDYRGPKSPGIPESLPDTGVNLLTPDAWTRPPGSFESTIISCWNSKSTEKCASNLTHSARNLHFSREGIAPSRVLRPYPCGKGLRTILANIKKLLLSLHPSPLPLTTNLPHILLHNLGPLWLCQNSYNVVFDVIFSQKIEINILGISVQ